MLITFVQDFAVVLCKRRLEKTGNVKKKKIKNGQKWPPSKGYSLCKMVTLGQKLKMHKNMLKTFLHDIGIVLGKKRLEKTPNIRRIRIF